MNSTKIRATQWTQALAFGFVCFWATEAWSQDQQPVSGRQPIVTNQFNTTTGGALQARRPGLYVQQGIAETQGNNALLTGDVPVQTSFFHDSAVSIMQSVFDSILNLVNSLGAGAPILVDNIFNSLGGLGGGGGGTMTPMTIPNPTTAGAGTMMTIP